ncbi:acyl-CoA N-acyltransferase [Auriculariales sp. MPI-PUGE-AT-0066]|nr:acyl-CoA N-acyltransferase [Auriculariales sp. MPI-PUGE-AT-0066]
MSTSGPPAAAAVYIVARSVHTVVTDGSTAKLVLRTFSPADAHTFRAYRSDPATARFQSWDPATYASEEHGLSLCEIFCKEQNALGARVFGQTDLVTLRGRWLQLALDADGAHIGDIGVQIWADGSQATIGITLLPAVTGRGYGRVAMRMALDWLFAAVPVPVAGGELQSDGSRSQETAEDEEIMDGVFLPGPAVRRVSADIDARNERSLRLFDRVGFRKEGVHIQASFCKGELTDDVDVAILRSEWMERKLPNV